MNKTTQSGAFGRGIRYANASTTPTGNKGPWTVTVINRNPEMGGIRIFGTSYKQNLDPSNTNTAKYANSDVVSAANGNLQQQYADGQTIKINAYPKTGYEFVSYTIGNQTYGDPLSLTVRENKTIYVNFKRSAVQTFTIEAVPNDPKMGTVSGGGTYAKGQTANLKATPNEGYKFVKWVGMDFGGNQSNQSNPVQHAVSGNRTFTAIFETSAGKIDEEHGKNDEDPGSGSGSGGGGGYSGGGSGYEPTGTITSTAEGLTMEKVVAFAKKNWIVLLVAAIVLYKIFKSKKK